MSCGRPLAFPRPASHAVSDRQTGPCVTASQFTLPFELVISSRNRIFAPGWLTCPAGTSRGSGMARLRLLTVLLTTLVAVNVSAQTTTGSLSGTVVDDSNNVVPGA